MKIEKLLKEVEDVDDILLYASHYLGDPTASVELNTAKIFDEDKVSNFISSLSGIILKIKKKNPSSDIHFNIDKSDLLIVYRDNAIESVITLDFDGVDKEIYFRVFEGYITGHRYLRTFYK